MSASKPENAADHVLILAPFGRDSVLLARVLKGAGIGAEPCTDMDDLCASIQHGAGAVLIADEALAGNGFQTLKDCLRRQPPWSDLPVFVMTQQNSSERWTRLKLLEPLGNITVLERPLRSETLISAFRMALRSRAHQYQLREQLEAEHKAALALRDSEHRYRTLAESMPNLVWTCDADGTCDYLSRQWLDYTGQPEEAQLGFGWLNGVHPDDQAMTEEAWRFAYQSQERYDILFRLRASDGTYRWFQSRGIPGRDERGQVQKWFGSCTDIEDQKRIAEERLELLAGEKKARKLAELLNRVGPVLLKELDSATLSQTVADLATQLTGAQFGVLYQTAEADAEESLIVAATSGSPPPEMQSQAPRFSPNGQDPLLSSTTPEGSGISSYLAVPIVSRAGDISGALSFGSVEPGVFEDLHVKVAEGIAAQSAIALENAKLFAASEQVQDTLRRSNAELQRANEDLNQFAYSASHDLQEPLRMVALYSQIIERKYRDRLDSAGHEYLNYVVQGARRMEMLLHDLLDYTQIISGYDDKAGQTDASEVVRTVLLNLDRSIRQSNAQIIAPKLPQLEMKEFHLLQLFQNLISNALKYRSVEPPRIEISAQAEGQFWSFRVRDNGIGIAPQYALQVFGLFRRLHGSSQYEGTGIGLAICQKIVERYGGRIWLESEGEGKGSTFCFTLPGI